MPRGPRGGVLGRRGPGGAARPWGSGMRAGQAGGSATRILSC